MLAALVAFWNEHPILHELEPKWQYSAWARSQGAKPFDLEVVLCYVDWFAHEVYFSTFGSGLQEVLQTDLLQGQDGLKKPKDVPPKKLKSCGWCGPFCACF